MKSFRAKSTKGCLSARGHSFRKILLTLLFILSVCGLLCLWVMSRPGHGPYWINVKQTAQLRSIDTAIELFKSEFGRYPPSDALDGDGTPYCGAMKLCEAAMGQDLMGIHPNSIFRRDDTDGKGTMLYLDANNLSEAVYRYNQIMRKGPYLPIETANAYRLRDLYQDVSPFGGNEYVLCDVYRRVTHIGSGKRVGMPILYYKARASKTAHDVNDPNNPENIYDYRDNHALPALGVPGKPGQRHPLFENPRIFYEMTRDYRTTGSSKPFRADAFILLSAGYDGLYGTQDDVANFKMKWKSK